MAIRSCRWRWAVLAAVGIAAAVLLPRWRNAIDHGGQEPAEPFRIAGNLYYVGANDVAAYLFADPAGHVLIDGGYRGTAPMIIRSMEKLGFRIGDVRILLNSHAHPDHAGGLAELKRASGAELWSSEGDAGALESGGDDPMIGIARPLVWSGLFGFPPVRVDHRLKDGEHVRLGSTDLVAHVTPGHTRGCTSWSSTIKAERRSIRVLEVCSISTPANLTLARDEPYPGFRGEYQQTLRVLRSLPVDIWLTPHARDFGRWRKYKASRVAGGIAAPFIDPAGYSRYLRRAELRFRATYGVK